MAIEFKRRIKPKVVVDMVPMIDIVFQLVIFFMVATTFKTTTGMELEIPAASLVSEISTAPLKISILSKDNILVGTKKTTLDNFKTILQEEVVKDSVAKRSVVLYGDKKMNYELLIEVMDVLRIEGYESIDLALTKRQN